MFFFQENFFQKIFRFAQFIAKYRTVVTIVDSITTWGNELILFPRSGNKSKTGVEFRRWIGNVSEFGQKLSNGLLNISLGSL